ncbi:hypothetical protein N2152v2_003986 [Parachlorella kessleri]
MRTLLIDNYDSYTYNLFQLLSEVNGGKWWLPRLGNCLGHVVLLTLSSRPAELPTVVHNDELDWEVIQQHIAEKRYHSIVISPGPGTPARPGDVGVCLPLLQAQLEIPLLGVCLGFQALALAHGARVTHAPEPVHGRLSAVQHNGHPLFRGIPSGPAYRVVRYHSLLVDSASLPACLEPLAWTAGGHHALQLGAADVAGGVPPHQASAAAGSPGQGDEAEAPRLLMALRHRSLPHYGVQFHPESVATGYGAELLRNFRDISAHFWGLPAQQRALSLAGQVGLTYDLLNGKIARKSTGAGGPPPRLAVHYQRLPGLLAAAGGSERLFWELFGETAEGGTAADTFWLDSAAADRGRFSFMGGPGGPLWKRVTYTLAQPSALPSGGAAAGGGPAGLPAAGAGGKGVAHVQEAPAAAAACAGASEETGVGSPHSAEAAVRQGPAAGAGAAPGTGQRPAGCARLPAQPGTVMEVDSAGHTHSLTTLLWDYLEAELRRWRCRVGKEEAQALPFDFWGGFVGYLGYELKAECGGSAVHASPLPDASLFLADRLLAVDHLEGDIYLLALYELGSSSGGASNDPPCEPAGSSGKRARECRGGCCSGGGGSSTLGAEGSCSRGVSGAGRGATLAAAEEWVGKTAARVRQLARDGQQAQQQQQPRQQAQQADQATSRAQQRKAAGPPPFRLREGRAQYLKNVQACKQALHDGESYEVCLTTVLSREGAPDARQLYTALRAVNPAPYAAWLSFGAGGPQVCCSSPERFLRLARGGVLEAKPIKGTAPRKADPLEDAQAAAELAASEKDRAENLMIVDLLRNDLGRVCEPGSVHVPGLMQIESYATVHQMVSTVRGARRQASASLWTGGGCSAVDCIRAAFPGGSMTGAPKIRTMEILDRLEAGPRGIYSGSIGFIGVNDTFDLNIVIRTAVLHQGQVSIGAGGAIVVQSEPVGEYDEMRLKASALLRAVGMCDGREGGGANPADVDES